MLNNENLYSNHIILNDDSTSFMGNLKTFYGNAFWNKSGENDKEILFALSDCHQVARIHAKNSDKEEILKFIKKLELIEKEAKQFGEYLKLKVLKDNKC